MSIDALARTELQDSPPRQSASFALATGPDGVREWSAADAADPRSSGLVWKHFEIDETARLPIEQDESMPEVVLNALVAAETRPRCDQVGDGALINLRGPAAVPGIDTDRLVSIRIWAHDNKVISVSRRSLAATATVEQAMRAGQLSDPGDLVSALARAISTQLDPQIAALGDDVDDCEIAMQESGIYRLRRKIAVSRSEAIAFRRFIAPERDALMMLASLPMRWLADEDRLHIREAADRFARMAEELEAIRERTALLHEQLTDLRSELIDQRSLSIAIVAFIFLPLTFITGLLGMNVEGIPFATEPWAFWGVALFCAAIALIVFVWFLGRHWLKD